LVHEAALTAGSLLSKITGKRVLGVNSSHHQAVLEPAEPLVATARSSDGIVEAMELKPDAARRMPFLLSVQFHPERLVEKRGTSRDFSPVHPKLPRKKKIMKAKVLIVDDEADVRTLLAAVLDNLYDVAAGRQRAALQKCFSRTRPT
jgi:PleD family two-component response regulator